MDQFFGFSEHDNESVRDFDLPYLAVTQSPKASESSMNKESNFTKFSQVSAQGL